MFRPRAEARDLAVYGDPARGNPAFDFAAGSEAGAREQLLQPLAARLSRWCR